MTVAKNYLHAQDVRLALNGRPRLEGNIYLPLSVAKLRGGDRWLASLSSDPFFDVDLTVEATDLAEFATAVRTKPDMSGQVSAKIQLSGTPASLQANNEIHLRDFVLDGAASLTADVETRLALGMANFKATAIARESDPVKIEGTLPLQLQKRDAEYALSSDGPLSATLNFPAIILAKLPRYLSPAVFTRGILSGNIAIADSVQHPLITGNANLVDGQFLRGSMLSSGVTFKGRNATIDFLHLRERSLVLFDGGTIPSLDTSGRGEISFPDADNVELKIVPAAPVLASPPSLAADDCVNTIEFLAGYPGILPARKVQEIRFGGSVFSRSFTISLPVPNGVDPPEVFPFCQDDPTRGRTLTFRIEPGLVP